MYYTFYYTLFRCFSPFFGFFWIAEKRRKTIETTGFTAIPMVFSLVEARGVEPSRTP